MKQLYWQVYLGLEREFLSIAEVVFIDDKQQEVYSMKIADLLIRTVVEIESIAKALYLENGGDSTIPDDEMYFDTVCTARLEDLWKLSKKAVFVVSPYIFFEQEVNKVLYPLHKATKRGDKSADWNRAYQAVKHNRVRELKKGNIKHLLHGLAALYVLNLYYRRVSVEDLSEADVKNFKPNFSSELFTVKIHQIHGISADGHYTKQEDYDECVYIQDYKDDTKTKAVEAMAEINLFVQKKSEQLLIDKANDALSKGEKITSEWISSNRSKIFSDTIHSVDPNMANRLKVAITGLRYNIVLNKQQY